MENLVRPGESRWTEKLHGYFQALWKDGKRARETVTFTVNHANRARGGRDSDVLRKQSTRNSYQIPYEYVSDPDGDRSYSRSFKRKCRKVQIFLREGQFTWSPSRSQFNSLKNNPLTVEFIVQDQPDKAETKGRIRIAQTHLIFHPNC